MRSLVEKATNEKLGDWLEEHPPEAKQIFNKATTAARARLAARQAARPHPPQVGARGRGPAGQARRLLVARPQRVRALHRGGQLGRLVGEGRTRPAHPGDPPDPRQDPQRRAGPHRQDAEERRDPGAHPGDRRRPRRGLHGRQDPLRQDHRPGRRRRRRLAHPHAAAHVLLPPDEGPRGAGSRLRRPAAALLGPGGQDQDLPEGRSRARARSSPRTRAASPRSSA